MQRGLRTVSIGPCPTNRKLEAKAGRAFKLRLQPSLRRGEGPTEQPAGPIHLRTRDLARN